MLRGAWVWGGRRGEGKTQKTAWVGSAGGSCRSLRASEGGVTRAEPWRKGKNPAGGAKGGQGWGEEGGAETKVWRSSLVWESGGKPADSIVGSQTGSQGVFALE